MRVGVTGASGLIGSATSAALVSQGIDVRNLSFRQMVELSRSETVALIKGLKLDAIIHMAWPASSTPDYLHSEENLMCALTTERLAQSQLELQSYLIAFGSVLDNGTDSSPYSKSKFMTRELLSSEEYSKTVSWLRPYFVFSNGRWPNFLKNDSKDQVIRLRDDSPREYIELSDIVTAVSTVLGNRLTGQVDIGSGYKRTPMQLLGALGLQGKLMESTNSFQDIPISDTALLRSKGWSPSVTDNLLGGDWPDGA